MNEKLLSGVAMEQQHRAIILHRAVESLWNADERLMAMELADTYELNIPWMKGMRCPLCKCAMDMAINLDRGARTHDKTEVWCGNADCVMQGQSITKEQCEALNSK